jgi:hypothetical protein
MSQDSEDTSKQKYFFSETSLIVGVIFTFLSIIDVFPSTLAAPLEWMGVFCLMSGLTYLSSLRITVPLAFTAFLFGTFLDPVVIGGSTFQTWIYSNIFVLVSALAGVFTGLILFKFNKKKGKIVEVV